MLQYLNFLVLVGFLAVALGQRFPNANREEMTAERNSPPSRVKIATIPVVPLPQGFRKPNRLQQIGGRPPPPPPPPSRRPHTTSTTTESLTEEVVGMVPSTLPPAPLTDISNETEIPVSTTSRPQRITRPTKKRPPPPPPVKPTRKPIDNGLLYSVSKMERDGSYYFDFLTANSIFRQEQGFFKANPKNKKEKIHVKTGAYGFTSPEGARFRIDFVADEKGFRAYDS